MSLSQRRSTGDNVTRSHEVRSADSSREAHDVMKGRHHEYDSFVTDPLMSLVDTIFSGDRGTHMVNRLSGWAGEIKVDATETKDAFLISADLPGVQKDNIKVSLSRDRILTIEAERGEESTREEVDSDSTDHRVHWQERTFGRCIVVSV